MCLAFYKMGPSCSNVTEGFQMLTKTLLLDENEAHSKRALFHRRPKAPACLCAEGKTKVLIFAVTLLLWDRAPLCTHWNPPGHAWLKLNLFCSDVKQRGVLGGKLILLPHSRGSGLESGISFRICTHIQNNNTMAQLNVRRPGMRSWGAETNHPGMSLISWPVRQVPFCLSCLYLWWNKERL